jgi:hypothetical protein
MPQVIVTTTETSSANGVPTTTGTAFIVGTTDQGPPPGGAPYVACQSLSQYVTAFGARSATSATLYDWLSEFYADGGQLAYVIRETDSTATTATLVLSDQGTHPTVVISALTPGLDGNNTYIVVVTATAPTFTATTTTSSANLTAISSMANIGVGTQVTGTGIPANTYILSVNTGASSAVMTAPITGSGGAGVVITPHTYTVEIEDNLGDILETHGPYYTTAQLYADTTSLYVTWAQSAGGGFTAYAPAALTSTPLAGGADASDLTDSSAVAALAGFPPTLGPGTVALPGKTSTTAWQGLLAHAQANNRFAALDMADNSSSAAVIAAAGATGAAANASYGTFIQGSIIIPGIAPNSTRTVPGSAGVAALRAQVAQTASQNQAPAGPVWGLSYPLGFTEFFGPAGAANLPAGSYQQSDVNTMSTAGINCWANYFSVLCLFGFVTPVSRNSDQTFWQASATCERMALVADCQQALAQFLFKTIDGAGLLINSVITALQAIIANHWADNALYGATAADAGAVIALSPLNTPATEAQGQLNSQLQVRISPYADVIAAVVDIVPITQSVA